MKIAVVGSGAVGGFIGASLWAVGADVTFIDRGDHLDAIRAEGLRVVGSDGTQIHAFPARVAESLTDAGRHDLVLLAVKAHQIAEVSSQIEHLCHENTCIVTLQNGLPWWYFERHGGEHEGRKVQSLDPDGRIAGHIDSQRVIGCVVYPALERIEPGLLRVVEGNRLTLGELDGAVTPRIEKLASLLANAGFKALVIPDIRNEIWLKLWGNLSFNPISALTRTTMREICQCPATRSLAAQMMREAEAVAARLGVTFRVTIERRLAGAEMVGAHKTSMLQDVEHGRSTEIEALVGSVIELGELTGIPTPTIRAVYACVKLLDYTLAARASRVD